MPHQDLTIDGEKWPSVSEVGALLAKPDLNRWREYKGTKEANRISKEAADRGRALHDLVERHLKGEAITFCGEAKELEPTFKVWFEWWTASGYKGVIQEAHVVSQKYKYHGTLDCILVNDNGEKVIVDWKFSNNDDDLRVLQLAGYAQGVLEHTAEKIKLGMIVRVDKLGKVHVTEYKNLWKYVPLFLGLRRVWDFVNQKGKFLKE